MTRSRKRRREEWRLVRLDVDVAPEKISGSYFDLICRSRAKLTLDRSSSERAHYLRAMSNARCMDCSASCRREEYMSTKAFCAKHLSGPWIRQTCVRAGDELKSIRHGKP